MKIKSFKDALPGIDLDDNVKILLNYTGLNTELIVSQAILKLTIIARALNEGWTPDWTNSNQYKYYPWFDLSNGFVFSDVDCIFPPLLC